MQKFVRNLLTEWRKLDLPFSNETIIIAVSGGADSTSTAFAFHQLKQRNKINNEFVIAHFNHKLRGQESDDDAKFVKNLAGDLQFKYVEGTADLQPQKNENLEQWARNKRYEFLFQTAEKENSKIILTAHTLNDQAETLLLNIIRGSGLSGLAGMKPVRRLKQKKDILLVRPLLNWAKRKDVEKFIKKNYLTHKNDSMNEDVNFQRVKIRKELLPTLEDYNPNIISSLANLAKLTSLELALSNELFQKKIFENKLFDEPYLLVKNLTGYNKPMLYKVLRIWLESQRSDLKKLNLKNIEAIESLIFSRKSGKVVELPGFGKVSKEGGKLFFEYTKVD